MNIKNLILSISLMMIVSSNAFDVGIEATDGLQTTYTCLSRAIGMFVDIGADEEYSSVAPTPAMLQICPTLDQTCCSQEVLDTLKNSFLKGKSDLWDIMEMYKQTLKTFNNKKKLIKTLNSDETARITKTCMAEDSNYNLDLIIKRVEDESEKMRIQLVDILDSTNKFYSGFACEICSGRFSKEFDISKEKTTLNYNTNNMHDIFERFVKYVPFFKFILDLSRLGKAAYCLKHDDAESFGVNISDENFARYKEFFDSCAGLTPEEIINNKKCLDLTRKRRYTYNFRTLENDYMLLELTKIAFENLDVGVLSNGNVASGGKFSIVYYPLNPKSADKFDNIKLELVSKDGLMMFANSMAEKLWKSSNILIVTFMSLVALLTY